jgi:hypothetical protein
VNTKNVNSAAGVILAALEQNRTAAGIALALESAGLLMTPETAADMASVSADAVRVAEESVAELKREHEANAALRSRVAELEPLAERLDFLDRSTLPDLRRRESYRQLAAQAREDGDFEGEVVVQQQLVEREAVWGREDELAKEFAEDPLAERPYSDAITRRIAPTQALREDKPAAKCRCDEPGADPYECEADDCNSHFSELNPFGGGPVHGHDAKVFRVCGACGWRTSVWHVDDGSAEEELHGHTTRVHGGAP